MEAPLRHSSDCPSQDPKLAAYGGRRIGLCLNGPCCAKAIEWNEALKGYAEWGAIAECARAEADARAEPAIRARIRELVSETLLVRGPQEALARFAASPPEELVHESAEFVPVGQA